VQDKLNITLVFSRCCTATGGQEAYARALGDHLAQRHNVSGIARLRDRKTPQGIFEFHESEGPGGVDRPDWRIEYLKTRPTLVPLLKQNIRLYTRPALQPLALQLLEAGYGSSLESKLPRDIDIVHYVGAGWDAISHVSLRAARRHRAIFAVSPFVHPGSWADSLLDIAFYDQADMVFVCSEYERDYLRKRGVTHANIHLTGIAPVSSVGGNAEHFREKHKLGNRPLLLFIGRKQQYKGYHALCRAMAKIQAAVPSVCLIAIGPATEPPFPEVDVNALLDIGKASEEEKADALAAASVFCMPSEAEAFGIVYVEAWANRLPVIAGGAPAVRELVQNGINGYRIENQNESEIAECAIRLLTDSDLRQSLGNAGYALQQKQYTWEAITNNHEQAYHAEISRLHNINKKTTKKMH
jgi:glycosyltransferase involved in cell wall biosynthesis